MSQSAGAAQSWKPSFSPWIIALAVMLPTFMEILDTSVANVSLPHIAGSFSAGVNEATWVLTSYLISNAIILCATPWLSSAFGRKNFFIACIILFTISSFLCGISSSLGMLITARVLQGIGGGALQPISQAVLFESFTPEKRGLSMAVFGLGVIFAPIIGPTLGGLITDNYSWHWIFLINIHVGIFAVILAQAFVEDPPYIKAAKHTKIDFAGFGLMSIWLATLQIILDKGQQADWFASSWVCWFAFISVISFILFVINEFRHKEPIVNLHILKNRNLTIGVTLMGVVGAVLYGTLALLPLYLQNLMQYTAQLSGYAISPRGIGSLCAILFVGRIIGKVDNRLLAVIGFGLLSYSCFLLANINLEINMVNIIWPNVLSGIALGFIFIPLTNLAFGTLKNEQIASGTSIFNLMRNIGGSFGISAVSTILTHSAQTHQANMVSHLNPYNPVFQERVNAVTQGLASHMDLSTASYKAQALIYGTLVQQSNLWGFVDNFRLFALLCLILIPLIFFLKDGKASSGQTALH